MMAVSAQFGTLTTSTKIPLDKGENELVTLKLTPTTTAPLTEQPKQLPALAAGTPAPEWKIAEWTDGKDRKLSITVERLLSWIFGEFGAGHAFMPSPR